MDSKAISDTYMDYIKNIVKMYLVEDTPENVEVVMSVFKDFCNQKLTFDQANDLIKPYMKSPDCLEKINPFINPGANQDTYPSITKRQKSRPWTPEEDKLLAQGVEMHGPNNWGAVAAMVGGNRTRAQCSQRWNRVINPKISKDQWTPEEEMKLIEAVNTIGQKSWTRIAAQLGNRSDVQCRFKYNFIMKKKTELQLANNFEASLILDPGLMSNEILDTPKE